MQLQSCAQSLVWEGLDGRQKTDRMWYRIFAGGHGSDRGPRGPVIAATSEDVLAIRASKMPRMRRGEAWEPKYQ